MEMQTIIFSILTIAWCLMIVGVIGRQVAAKKNKDGLPHLATILGVLGTFVGICGGLLFFNVEDIDKSVPTLLSGLRLAFITSVFGMGTAVVLRIKYESIEEEEADPVAAITESLDPLTEIAQSLSELDTNIGEKCAEAIRDSIRHTLMEMMQEFNAEISEQCGESFRKLSDATDNLVAYQETHRGQMEAQHEQMENAVRVVKICEATLTEVVKQSEAFSDIADRLGSAIEHLDEFGNKFSEQLGGALSDAIHRLDAFSGAFNERMDNTVKQFDEIRGKFSGSMEDQTRQIIEAVKLSIDALGPAQEAIKRGSESLERALPEMEEKMLNAILAFQSAANSLGETMQEQRQSIREQQNEANIAIRAAADKVGDSFEEMLAKSTQELGGWQRSMEEAIRNSIESLGNAMLALSEKFVTDYEPLIEEMGVISDALRRYAESFKEGAK